MKTPYGFECKYFYGDYFRGKNKEECRLLNLAAGQGGWSTKLCKNCPSPAIQRANGCQFLVQQGRISNGFLGLSPHVEVKAFCQKKNVDVTEPSIGCGSCNDLPFIIVNEE
jgi:hypothetical protein